MHFLDAGAVHRLLDYPGLIDALCAHHREEIDARAAQVLEQPTPGGGVAHFLSLPAWQRGKAIGEKICTVFPHNEHNGSGLPTVQAVYLLFDGANGEPLACMDGTALTLRKTAADSALGARFLAREDSRVMLMVGAGALAAHCIMAHRVARPAIERVIIWNRTASRARALAEQIDMPGLRVEVATDLGSAAREADLVCCATRAEAPLIRGRWLSRGAHLDLIGGYRPSMREADDEAVSRADVFVDSRWSAVEDCGDIRTPLASGVLRMADIRADLFELVRGAHPGRRGRDAITLFKNGGGGHLDLMVARHLYAQAAARGALGGDVNPG